MIAEDLKGWGQLLASMREDEALLARATAMNEWFTPDSIQLAIGAMLPWFEGNLLTTLRNTYPTVRKARRIGLILAGNLPFVGLHDVLMVLLSGHIAVVKPSHKDAVLLLHLLNRSSPEIQQRVSIKDRILPEEIDFLIATGSNTTARQIEASFANVPKLIRKSRFSVAVLDGNESESALTGLADDVLMYHGLGCRSVASILIPQCIVGAHHVPLGQAQRPRLDDFADGIDTLQLLTGLA
ncbi:MAG: hypothetical protein IPP17_19025 [Bacteroidetes bacterium]|nr:hypothetical protein [Bacteroidota bacterium]